MPVYLFAKLSNLNSLDQYRQLPSFNHRLRHLKSDEYLLVAQYPEHLLPLSLQLYFRNTFPNQISCLLPDPHYVSLPESQGDNVAFFTLPGLIHPTCSKVHLASGSSISFNQAQAADVFPDGLQLTVIPASKSKKQDSGTDSWPAITGKKNTPTGGWFYDNSFRPGFWPGGGGLSNLLDILVMPALLSTRGSNWQDSLLPAPPREGIIIEITGHNGQFWQYSFNREETASLLESIEDADELLSRLWGIELTVSSVTVSEPSALCRESLAVIIRQLLEPKQEATFEVPGIINLPGGQKADKGTQTSLPPASEATGTNHQPGGGSLPGTTGKKPSAGGGGGDQEDEDSRPKKIPSRCESSDPDLAARNQVILQYSFMDSQKRQCCADVAYVPDSLNYLLNYQCPICKNICLNPVSMCGLHITCEFCHQQSQTWQRCPVCMEHKQKTYNERHRWSARIINSIPVYCPNRVHGCQASMGICEVARHYNEHCPYTVINCPKKGCLYTATRQEFSRNHKAVCDYEIINCYNSAYGCRFKDIRKNLPYHQKICPYQLIQCPAGCPQRLRQFETYIHIAFCPEIFIPCRNEGCNQQIARKNWAEHHHLECPHQLGICFLCQERYPLNEMGGHLVECSSASKPDNALALYLAMKEQLSHLKSLEESPAEAAELEFLEELPVGAVELETANPKPVQPSQGTTIKTHEPHYSLKYYWLKNIQLIPEPGKTDVYSIKGKKTAAVCLVISSDEMNSFHLTQFHTCSFTFYLLQRHFAVLVKQQNSFLNFRVYFIPGVYDDGLPWPFGKKHRIQISLLDRQGGPAKKSSRPFRNKAIKKPGKRASHGIVFQNFLKLPGISAFDQNLIFIIELIPEPFS